MCIGIQKKHMKSDSNCIVSMRSELTARSNSNMIFEMKINTFLNFGGFCLCQFLSFCELYCTSNKLRQK